MINQSLVNYDYLQDHIRNGILVIYHMNKEIEERFSIIRDAIKVYRELEKENQE